jgi:hypothetical protein
VAASRAVQRATKPLLVAMSKHLERQALALGGPAVVAATFQHARQFTPATSRRYARLAESAELVVALGVEMPSAPVAGVVGAAFDPSDPIVDEWSIVVVGPHFAGGVLARDFGDAGPEETRRFDYVVTYDRDLVLAAASSLLRRVRVLRSGAPAPERLRASQLGAHPDRVLLDQPVARVEPSGGVVGALGLEEQRAAPGGAGPLDHAVEQQAAQTLAAPAVDDEELVEQALAAAGLQAPPPGEHGVAEVALDAVAQ